MPPLPLPDLTERHQHSFTSKKTDSGPRCQAKDKRGPPNEKSVPMTTAFATAVAVVFIIVGLAVLAVIRMRKVHEAFNFIVEPLGKPVGEYVPAFAEIDPLTQDIPEWTRHIRCLRCEITPVPASGPSVFCDPCRAIIAAVPAEPIEPGVLR